MLYTLHCHIGDLGGIVWGVACVCAPAQVHVCDFASWRIRERTRSLSDFLVNGIIMHVICN